VIASGYGGQMDYLGADDCCIVPHHMVPVHEPTWAVSYRSCDRWAEPSVEQASRWMRAMVESPAGFRQRAARQGERIRNDFSSAAVTRRLLQALEGRAP